VKPSDLISATFAGLLCLLLAQASCPGAASADANVRVEPRQTDELLADPQYYASKGYPAWNEWPYGEALWNAPYCYANNEFTPQQSMRGKMCLLAYLYSLGQTYSAGNTE